MAVLLIVFVGLMINLTLDVPIDLLWMILVDVILFLLFFSSFNL